MLLVFPFALFGCLSVCFFGLVLGLGFYHLPDLLGTCVFPKSRYG